MTDVDRFVAAHPHWRRSLMTCGRSTYDVFQFSSEVTFDGVTKRTENGASVIFLVSPEELERRQWAAGPR